MKLRLLKEAKQPPYHGYIGYDNIDPEKLIHVTLFYDDLGEATILKHIDSHRDAYDPSWLEPDEDEEIDIKLGNYEYYVDIPDVLDFIIENDEVLYDEFIDTTDEAINEVPIEKAYEFILSNFDEYIERNELDILKYFCDDAKEKATEEAEEEYNNKW